MTPMGTVARSRIPGTPQYSQLRVLDLCCLHVVQLSVRKIRELVILDFFVFVFVEADRSLTKYDLPLLPFMTIDRK